MNVRMTGPWADDDDGMVVTHNGPNAADIFERALRNMAGKRGNIVQTDEPGMEVDEQDFIDMLGAENIDDALYGDGRRRVAQNDAELDARAELERWWAMPIPGGVAGNEVYRKRMKAIKELENKLRSMGLDPYENDR